MTAITSSSRSVRSCAGRRARTSHRRLGQRLLGARDPLADRRLGDQEPARDFGGGQPADQAQGQRRPRLRRQRRVAAQEDQPQDVVLDVVDLGVEIGHAAPPLRRSLAELLGLAAQRLRTAELVDGPTLGRRHQPGARAARDRRRRATAPARTRSASWARSSASPTSRVIRVSGAHQAGRLGTPGGGDRVGGGGLGWHPAKLEAATVAVDLRRASGVGEPRAARRRSAAASPPWRPRASTSRAARRTSRWSAIASSSVSYCRIAHPPTTSLASAYGPSTRVTSPLRTMKLTASSVPYNPPPSRNTPAAPAPRCRCPSRPSAPAAARPGPLPSSRNP